MNGLKNNMVLLQEAVSKGSGVNFKSQPLATKKEICPKRLIISSHRK